MRNLLEKLTSAANLKKLANACLLFLAYIVYCYVATPIFNALHLFEAGNIFMEPHPTYVFIMAVVLAPLWEEYFFRVLPAKFANELKPSLLWPTMVFSSFIFGFGNILLLSHHSTWPGQLVYQFLCGLGFSYLYIKNGFSYWPNVICHALINYTLIYVLK